MEWEMYRISKERLGTFQFWERRESRREGRVEIWSKKEVERKGFWDAKKKRSFVIKF